MAEITTVLITYGKLRAVLEISYRWYVSGEDPWERTEGRHIISSGGGWYQHKTGTISLHNGKGASSMYLSDFDRKDLGRKGVGRFHGYDAWYNIPKNSNIKWEIVDFY